MTSASSDALRPTHVMLSYMSATASQPLSVERTTNPVALMPSASVKMPTPAQ